VCGGDLLWWRTYTAAATAWRANGHCFARCSINDRAGVTGGGRRLLLLLMLACRWDWHIG